MGAKHSKNDLCSTDSGNCQATNKQTGTNELLIAIESKNIVKVSELLKNLDLDEINGKKNGNGETALHIACRELFNEALELLVSKNGVDINVQDNFGVTPLHLGIKYQNGRSVSKFLTSPGIDVNIKDKYGQTPLHWAGYYNRPQMVPQLLAIPGIDVNVKSNVGKTPLHLACADNHHQIVSQLLPIPGIDVNYRSRDGCTPIMFSANRCSEEALKLMLDEPGVDLDGKDDQGRELEVFIEISNEDTKRKEKCLVMIFNEKKKRGERKLELKLTNDPIQDTSEDHDRLEALKKFLECSICTEPMKPPTRIWMCRSSHTICEACKNKLPQRGRCPMCMIEQVNLRAFGFENVARIVFKD